MLLRKRLRRPCYLVDCVGQKAEGFLSIGMVYQQRNRAGISFQPIRLKAAFGTVAALCMCVSQWGKSTHMWFHSCLYIFMCVCVSIRGFLSGSLCVCMIVCEFGCWWVCARPIISSAFDAHSFFLSFVKHGRGGGGLALWHFPVQNQERPQPLKTPVIGRGAMMSLFHLRKSDCTNKAKLEDLSVIQTLC